MGDILTLLPGVLLVVNFLFGVIIVFFERKDPAVTWAWLMVVFVLPYFGFLLYILLGFDGRKGRLFLHKAKADERLYNQFLEMTQSEHNDFDGIPRFEASLEPDQTDSAIVCYHEGGAKFDALLQDIHTSERFICLQYYIVRHDDLCNRLVHALAQKARAGVQVRFLIDGMGCVLTVKRVFAPLLEAGGQLAVFFPPHFMRLNFRNHRKLAVIDGHVGYIGGLNIGDEYLGKSKRFGYWRDCHIRLEGEAVHRLSLRFMMDWNFAAVQKMDVAAFYFPQPITTRVNQSQSVQVVSSGPDTKWPSIQYGYTKMISRAARSLYIQTPYFVPDDSVLEAIRVAALSGVDVRIVIPAKPDHPFVYWAGLSCFGALLDAGVKCYLYEKGFMHSKLVIADAAVVSVGTANMDVRSFKLNFEVNAFINCPQTAQTLTKFFMADLDDCTEVTSAWYQQRPFTTRIKESVARLLSPIL